MRINNSKPARFAAAPAEDGLVSIQAVFAFFSSGSSGLSVIGDDLANTIVADRNAAGAILVNGGAVAIAGGTPTVANTARIVLHGRGGDDILSFNEASGALPAGTLIGGGGNDILTAGSSADLLFGQVGNDTLLGKANADSLFGGSGNDLIAGGDGDDLMFGEAGNDRLVWNPGDDTDLMEGGDGVDTAEVNGGNGAESFTILANGSRLRIDRVAPAPFALDAGTIEEVVINANGGDDVVTAGNGIGSLARLLVDGGAGDDMLGGGDGDDLLIGGDGNDRVAGGRGADTALLGAGDDRFVWNPGDLSDTVEGQAGADTLEFHGSNASETIDLSANGGRVRFLRDVASVAMDLDDVEAIRFDALGGADTILVGDLGGTDLLQLEIALAATLGGTAGDVAADRVTVNGSAGADAVLLFGQPGSLALVGLDILVTVTGAEATDQLLIALGGGGDSFSAETLAAGQAQLSVDGGAGNDLLLGSPGADTLIGGGGADTIDGNRGDDVGLLGAGNDLFVWDPGDGNDVVEGQDGTDTFLLNGAAVAETVSILANGTRTLLFRDVGAVTIDINDVERIQYRALGGADTVIVGDLSGLDVGQVIVDLAGLPGQGDGLADQVRLQGTFGDDRLIVGLAGASVLANGLSAALRIDHADAGDRLILSGFSGADLIDAGVLAAGKMAVEIEGGSGDDVLIGSKGSDRVLGGAGADIAQLGEGDDIFTWNPGDGSDMVEGGAGADTLAFNGSAVNENIDIAANGDRVRLTRDVAAVVMDLEDVETIAYRALGGLDTIVVDDLAGTGLDKVSIDLAALAGGTAGDGQLDTIVVRATDGADTVTIVNVGGVIRITGLAAQVEIRHFDADDRIVIVGLGGDDVVDASALSGILFSAVGGDGDDLLIGSPGGDVLLGGAGDDVLLGGDGFDEIDPGTGSDIVVQGFSPSIADMAIEHHFG